MLQRQRPQLLVSVRNAGEALEAIVGGTDIIDVKEPSHGPMGPAAPDTIDSIVKCAQGRRPISAALGDIGDAIQTPPPAHVDFVKIGLANAPSDWPDLLCRRLDLSNRPPRVAMIAVAYADHHQVAAPPVDEMMAWAIKNRAVGLLLDTAKKDGLDLFHWITSSKISQLIRRGRRAGLTIALAGSLSGRALRRAILLGPDIVAVRGAACHHGDRVNKVCRNQVRAIATVVSRYGVTVSNRAG